MEQFIISKPYLSQEISRILCTQSDVSSLYQRSISS
jgi:hypothetical protein